MKKATFLTAFICICFHSFAQNADDENIKKTIQAETDAIHNRNLEALTATWQHNPNVSYTFYSRQGYSTMKGWDSLNAIFERSFKALHGIDSTKIAKENYQIQTSGNMAWVEYDEVFPPTNQQQNGTRYHNYRTLVKDDDQWKSISFIRTDPDSYNSNNDQKIEDDLNATGYNLLAQKKVNEAIEVFKLNVKLFPNSWNPYDSLGEAYALAGNKKLAIENYEKSVKLNPKSESGPQALAKLKQK